MELVEDDGRFVASIPDLPGCDSFGDTPEEAVSNLKATKQLWLEGALASGQTIVEPSTIDDFSGKFVLRIPRVLHQALDREARQQGVSLNAYVGHVLSERHKETALEALTQKIAVAYTSSPFVDCLEYEHSVRSQWRHQDTANHWHLDLKNVGSCGAHGKISDDLIDIDMVPYLPQPPKAYRAVVKQRKLTAYGNV